MQDSAIKISLTTSQIEKWRGNTIAVGVYDDGQPQAALSRCGASIKKEVKGILKDRWIKGKAGETLLIPTPRESGVPAARILLIGMGKKNKIDAEALRRLGAQLGAACKKHDITSVNSLLGLDKHNTVKPVETIAAVAEGIWLGSYDFADYRSKDDEEKEEKPAATKMVFSVDKEQSAKCRKLLTEVDTICRGVALARDLGNKPGNVLNPETLAAQATELGKKLPIKTTIMTEKALAKKNMNGILGVGKGSGTKPRLITMEYKNGGDKPLLAVVGKAITFDSGGISIKPSNKMEEMKFDMSGGAAVFGFMQAIAEMKLPVNVVGVVPTAENIPSSSAQRPGDIIKTAKGIFVEVINTDAEGRLILADALHHAESFKPEVIIDLATLTGACVVALGAHASGVMGNDDDLLQTLRKVGDDCGDRVWPLPMFDAYQEQIKSTVADIKNVGGPGAGTITAGCFLSRFIEEKRKWAHIDIAGTAWDMTGSKPHVPKGATGVGVRLLYRYAAGDFT